MPSKFPYLSIGWRLVAAFLVATATTCVCQPSYPTPLPCTGEACTTFSAAGQDFNVLQHQNGTYFRISKDNGTLSGMVLASAPALSGPWVLRQQILGPGVPLVDYDEADRSNTSLWAPELHHINGTYYCYYSMFNRQVYPGFSIRVATSPTMDDGSWTDQGTISVPVPHVANEYAIIDMNLLASYETDPYGAIAPYSIVWGSFGSALFGMQLNSSDIKKVSTTPPPAPVIQDQYSPDSPASNAAHPGHNRTEGSFHIQMNDWIYFFFSRGDCCSAGNESYAYVTQVCRAKTSNGPFYDRAGLDCAGNANGTQNGSGTTILESHSVSKDGKYEVFSPGSVGIVKTTQGPAITYQYINQSSTAETVPLSFSFGYNYLGFDSDGWPFLSETPQHLGSESSNTTMVATSGCTSSTTAAASTTTTTSNAEPSTPTANKSARSRDSPIVAIIRLLSVGR